MNGESIGAQDQGRSLSRADATGRLLISPSVSGWLGPARIWLALLVLATTSIVLIDGIQRNYRFDDSAIESLHYAGLPLTYVFAAVSLPLSFGFASAVGLSKKSGLVLWFILGTTAFTKDFAYIHWPGLPLYVTDIVWALLFLFYRHNLRGAWKELPRLARWFLLLFLGLGCLDLLRSLLGGRSSILAMRDFAIVLYVLFVPIGYLFAENRVAVRSIFLFAVLGTLLGTFDGVLFSLRIPGERRYLVYGLYVAIAFTGLLVVTIQKRWRVPGAWFFIIILGIGCVLSNARTLDLDVILAVCLSVLAGAQSLRDALRLAAKFAAGAGILLLLAVLLATRTASFRELADRATIEFVSGTVDYVNDDDARFRLLAWAEAISRFGANPVFGEGYGVPFSFELADTDVRPHNTYLTVLYKMGIVGLASLLGALMVVGVTSWRAFRCRPRTSDGTVLLLLLMTLFMMLTYGALNLFLESPFFAAPFWLLIGITIARSTRTLRYRPTAGTLSQEHIS